MLARHALRRVPRASRCLREPRMVCRYASNQQGRSQGGDFSTAMQSLSGSALHAFSAFSRYFRMSLFGVAAVGLTTFTAYEAVHMWVETIGMAPERDEETRRWEWDRELDNWSTGERGGTDAALGVSGRHALRGAWISEMWGAGAGDAAVSYGRTAGKPNAVDPHLATTYNFLLATIRKASTVAPEKLRPDMMFAVLARLANVLERMGTPNTLFEARALFEQLWTVRSQTGFDAARSALKLGDLNYRLGDAEDAQAWWARTFSLVSSAGDEASKDRIVVPETTPTSPYAQRTLTSALVSVSAYYAATHQLRRAKGFDEDALHLLRSIPAPSSLAITSPPQALHHLYLMHRGSLLSIHLAEVNFALRAPVSSSVQSLESAAEASGRVAFAVSGAAVPSSGAATEVPPSKIMPISATFAKSISMKGPATALLRDARRSAAEAWNLLGVLREQTDSSNAETALVCYERALKWAGVELDRHDEDLDPEWALMHDNYVRAKKAALHRSGT